MNKRSGKARCAWAGRILILASVIVRAGVQPAEAQSEAAGGVPKVEDVFSNIQALRGMPADQLRPTMMLFSAALGVPCTHCHVQATDVRREAALDTVSDAEYRKLLNPTGRVQPDWWYHDPKREVETPKKQMARMMIRMVAAINKENFGGRTVVTCFTCHRGSPQPVSSTVYDAATVPRATASDSPSASGPTADQLLDKFVAALGGAAAIEMVSTRVAGGTLQSSVMIGGEVGEGRPGAEANRPPRAPLALEISSKAPGMRMVVIREGNGVARSFHGNAGWHQNRFSNDLRHQPRDFRGDELDTEKMEDPYFFAGQLKQWVRDWRVERVETIAGKEAYVVSGRTQFLPRVQLYFERESGMLVRLTAFIQTPVGLLGYQRDFADFRTVDGVQVPFRWASSQPGDRTVFTYQLDQVQQNIPIADSKFVKPSRYLVLFRPNGPAR